MHEFEFVVESVDLNRRHVLETTCLLIKDLEFS
jgi:hypothetical protein